MAVVEEYALEIEYGAAPAAEASSASGLRARVRPVLESAARRMRAAPLVVLFVAFVVGFAAFRTVVELIVGAIVYPDVLAGTINGTTTSAIEGAVLQVLGLMALAAVAGLAGAVAVFWKQRLGWSLLAAFAAWQVAGSWVTYTLLVSALDLPAGVVPSWWASQDVADWLRLAIALAFLGLLFLPSVLRWVFARPDPGVPDEALAHPSNEAVSLSGSRPWSVLGTS